MAIGIVGKKTGMTRVFTEEGQTVPVTVIEFEANRVCQVKTPESDQYSAIQVAVGQSPRQLNRAATGHFSKANIQATKHLIEFRLEADEALPEVGSSIELARFSEGQKVDVTSRSKGKGFAGVVKRWNFRTQDASHGNSLSHRAPGSIGQCQAPGKVFKGKKMAGHMGDRQVTTQNLKIVRVDVERNILLIKGAVPGANGAQVIIKPASKIKR